MVLNHFSQPKLVRHMEILVDNGPSPEAQAVIGPKADRPGHRRDRPARPKQTA